MRTAVATTVYTLLQSTMDDSRENLKKILQVNPNWQPDNPDDELKVQCTYYTHSSLSYLLLSVTAPLQLGLKLVSGLMQSDCTVELVPCCSCSVSTLVVKLLFKSCYIDYTLVVCAYSIRTLLVVHGCSLRQRNSRVAQCISCTVSSNTQLHCWHLVQTRTYSVWLQRTPA
jgi:hypothetical protein